MNYFEYTVPYVNELREKYFTPYRFSEELRNSVTYMYSHPVANAKWHKVFSSLATPDDNNDMLKVAYLMLRYYLDYPQRFNHNVENVLPHMIVRMWRTFISLHKHLRGVKFEEYMSTNMQMLKLSKGSFIEIFLSDIEKQNIIYESEEMVKDRGEDIGLHETRNPTHEGGTYFEYLCTLE